MKNLILTKEEALKEYVLTYTKKITEEKEPSSDNLKYKYQERVKQLTIFIKKAFEAKAKGEIPVDIYTSMVKQYSNELETINDQLSKITAPVIETHNYLEDATTFINLIKSYNEETPLTYDLIHAIFKQIRIKVVKDNPRRRKTRKIFYITYNYIDDIIKEFISDGK